MTRTDAREIPRRAMLGGAALCSCAAALAQALPEEKSPPADPPKVQALGTVTVTVTRRTEPLVKVPMAVTVIGGERMQQEGLNNLRDLVADVPSLQFRSTASAKDQAVFLRGMGTVSTSPAVEPTTAMVVDGVPLARQGQVNLDLLEVERIEVLRGPQGTLFGKNASAGVVQVISKPIARELSGFAEAGYFGGGSERRVKGAVSGPLVAGQWNAMVGGLHARYGGNVTNVHNGQTVNGYQHHGGVARLEYVGTRDFRAQLSLDAMKSRDTTPQGVVASTTSREFGTGKLITSPAFATELAPVLAGPDNRAILSSLDGQAEDLSAGLALQMDWTLDSGHKWTSITARRRWTNQQVQDQTRLPAASAAFALMHDRGELDFSQLSQELRVASPIGGAYDYVAGLFFMRGRDQETYRRDTTQSVSGSARLNQGVADYGTTSTNYALFGEWTQHLSPAWKALAGMRWVRDDLSYHFTRSSTSATPVPGIQTHFQSAAATRRQGYAARLGSRYDLTPESNLYATVARGYKGPAYNLSFSMLPQDVGALRPETSVAYELGYKLSFDRNRSVLSLALFRQNFSDYQVNFRDLYNGSIVTRLVNAGRVFTEGLEAELAWQPQPALRINAALAYTRARVASFTCPPGTNASCNINGQPLPFAPDWKASLAAQYRLPLGDAAGLTLGSSFNWQSQTQYDINQTPETIQPAYGLLNAFASWENGDGWTVSVLAKNITNQHYSTNLARFNGGIVRWVPRDAGRYMGVSLRKDF